MQSRDDKALRRAARVLYHGTDHHRRGSHTVFRGNYVLYRDGRDQGAAEMPWIATEMSMAVGTMG